VTAISVRRFQPRAPLATIALVSFMFSFIVARTFTTFFPSIVLVSNGIHVHHFWFGIALLAAGGWIGISYDDKETSRVAAILYGAGGGLIVDEVGLLLTFNNYWTSLTYTFLIIFLAFITILMLFYRYRLIISKELSEFVSSKVGFYLMVLLAAVSIAFITQTDNFLVTVIAGGLTVVSIIVIVIYIVVHVKIIPKKEAVARR
jgi:hypothetical protein